MYGHDHIGFGAVFVAHQQLRICYAMQLVVTAFNLDEAQAWILAEYPWAAELFAAGTDRWEAARSTTGLVPLQLARLLDCLSSATWDAGFVAYCSTRADEISDYLGSFIAQNPAQRCQALLDACAFTSSSYRAAQKRANIDWRFFGVADLATLAPTPSSELVRRVGLMLALEQQELIDANECKPKIRTLLSCGRLPRSAVGFGVEAAVISAMGLEPRLPVSVLVGMGVQLPRGYTRKDDGNVRLHMQLFRTPPPPESPREDKAVILVPATSSYQHVDGVILYASGAGLWVVIGVQVTLTTPRAHERSLEFITSGHWEAFAPAGQRESAKAALLWITPEEHPELPGVRGVKQGHLPLRHFNTWVPSEMYVASQL